MTNTTGLKSLVLAAVLVSAGALAACGGGTNGGDDVAAEQNTTREQGTAATTATAESAMASASQSSAGGQTDGRRTLVLPAKARETVLHEMRLLLEALHGVIVATAEGDRGAMAREARSGGTAIAVDRDPAMARRLPAEFVELGSSTHIHFDSLAARIERGIGRDSVLSELGSLTNKCVACHAGYRVATPAMQGGDGG